MGPFYLTYFTLLLFKMFILILSINYMTKIHYCVRQTLHCNTARWPSYIISRDTDHQSCQSARNVLDRLLGIFKIHEVLWTELQNPKPQNPLNDKIYCSDALHIFVNRYGSQYRLSPMLPCLSRHIFTVIPRTCKALEIEKLLRLTAVHRNIYNITAVYLIIKQIWWLCEFRN